MVCNVCLDPRAEESVLWDLNEDSLWLGMENMSWFFIQTTVSTTIGVTTQHVRVPAHLCDACQRVLLNRGLLGLKKRKRVAK